MYELLVKNIALVPLNCVVDETHAVVANLHDHMW